MEKEIDLLSQYIPDKSVVKVWNLIKSEKNLVLKITNKRTTKLGDYKIFPYGKYQISINYDLNPYQFLLTLLHELAHHYTYKKFGRNVKPHGREWKTIFGNLISEFNHPEIFPENIMLLLKNYAQNPSASTSGDGKLFIELSKFDSRKDNNLKYVFELLPESIFKMENGQIFQLKEKRRTRYVCINISNKKKYLIHQNAKVYPLENKS